jgi:hypothetical protein
MLVTYLFKAFLCPGQPNHRGGKTLSLVAQPQPSIDRSFSPPVLMRLMADCIGR